MKRFLSLLPVIALIVMMLVVPASAEETESRYVVIDQLTQSATLIVEPAVDPNAVAMVPDGPSFTTLEAAVAYVQTIPEADRPYVAVLKDCEITQPIPVTNGLVNIFPSEYGVPHTITSKASSAFTISNGATLLINDLDFTTSSGKYIFNITGDDSGVLLAGEVACNISGATEAAIHVAEGVNNANIQVYGGSVSGKAAIELNGSKAAVTVAGMSPSLTGTGSAGALVVNGDGTR